MGSEGAGGVIGEALGAAAAELAAAEAEQLPMFQVPVTRETAREEAQAEAEQRVKAGRPKGAQNLATRELREYLLRRGISPLVSMMSMSLHSPKSLARELGCKRIDAARLILDYQRALAPFLHATAAPEDSDGKPVPLFQMIVGADQLTIGAPIAGEAPWKYLDRLREQAQQNQSVSATADPGSHDAGSHGGAK